MNHFEGVPAPPLPSDIEWHSWQKSFYRLLYAAASCYQERNFGSALQGTAAAMRRISSISVVPEVVWFVTECHALAREGAKPPESMPDDWDKIEFSDDPVVWEIVVRILGYKPTSLSICYIGGTPHNNPIEITMQVGRLSRDKIEQIVEALEGGDWDVCHGYIAPRGSRLTLNVYQEPYEP